MSAPPPPPRRLTSLLIQVLCIWGSSFKSSTSGAVLLSHSSPLHLGQFIQVLYIWGSSTLSFKSSASGAVHSSPLHLGQFYSLIQVLCIWGSSFKSSTSGAVLLSHSSPLHLGQFIQVLYIWGSSTLSFKSSASGAFQLYKSTIFFYSAMSPRRRLPTSLATGKPSSCNCVPTAGHPTVCVNTEIVPQELLPLPLWREEPALPSEDPGPTPHQPPQKELLELSHTVDIYTTLSTMAADLGNPSFTYSHVSSYTDWCWEFCSTLIYKGAPPSAATNCLPLAITHHQNPAVSSMPILTGAERKTAELWLLKQAKIHLYNSEKSSICKKRFFSKSSRLMPWHPVLDYSQIFTAGRVPANSIFHSLQQHQLLADVTNSFTYKWFNHLHLTLCHYGSIFSCTTGTKLPLLSARRLSRLVYSNSYWRNQPHLHHQFLGELSSLPTSFTSPFLHMRMDSTNPSTFRKGHIQNQTTAASETALHGFTTRSNLRKLHEHLAIENNHYFIHLHFIKLFIRWLHIPAENPQLRSLWENPVKSMMAHLQRIMEPLLLTLEKLTASSTSLNAKHLTIPLGQTISSCLFYIDPTRLKSLFSLFPREYVQSGMTSLLDNPLLLHSKQIST